MEQDLEARDACVAALVRRRAVHEAMELRLLREEARRRAHQAPDELWATLLYLHDLGRRLADLGGEREGWEANVRRSEAEGNERIRAWARRYTG